MTAYATIADVYAYGLPRGALGNPGRLVDSMLAANSTVTLNEHGYVLNDAVTFRATEGGTLSPPLVAGTVYYVLPGATDSTFQVAATPSGPPITLTGDGTSVVVTSDLPFAKVLEFYSRFADDLLPAHAVPLTTPYPITVVAIVAELTAKKIQILSGTKSGSMDEAEQVAMAQLKRYGAGIPTRDVAPTTRPANLAVTTRVRDNRIGRANRFRGPDDNGGFNQ